MKKIALFLLIVSVFSCAEKLLDKPNNLIAKDKMVLIYNDLAIVNAAKSTNITILRENNIEPTNYIFEKYSIDSLQFVESDRYYASIPEDHEAIYTAVEAKLSTEKDRIEMAKKLKDSLRVIERDAAKLKLKLKDSLLKIEEKKK